MTTYTRHEVAAALRILADQLENHPDVKTELFEYEKPMVSIVIHVNGGNDRLLKQELEVAG